MKAIDYIKQEKFNFIAAVPCSEIKETLAQLDYVPATREDEAIGIAVGAYFAGKKPLVIFQNTGLGVSINAILSLLKPYGIKIQLMITQHNTAEHHKVTTEKTIPLLRTIDYDNYILVQSEMIINE